MLADPGAYHTEKGFLTRFDNKAEGPQASLVAGYRRQLGDWVLGGELDLNLSEPMVMPGPTNIFQELNQPGDPCREYPSNLNCAITGLRGDVDLKGRFRMLAGKSAPAVGKVRGLAFFGLGVSRAEINFLGAFAALKDYWGGGNSASVATNAPRVGRKIRL